MLRCCTLHIAHCTHLSRCVRSVAVYIGNNRLFNGYRIRADGDDGMGEFLIRWAAATRFIYVIIEVLQLLCSFNTISCSIGGAAAVDERRLRGHGHTKPTHKHTAQTIATDYMYTVHYTHACTHPRHTLRRLVAPMWWHGWRYMLCTLLFGLRTAYSYMHICWSASATDVYVNVRNCYTRAHVRSKIHPSIHVHVAHSGTVAPIYGSSAVELRCRRRPQFNEPAL